MEVGDNKPRCGKCDSTQVYIRRITNERVCRICGWVENLNKGIMNLETEREDYE